MPVPRENEPGFDLNRILEETFVEHVRYHETLDSTNNTALEYCQEEALKTPLLVVAGEQTSGRGRGSNQWWSSQGSLTFSIVLHPDHLGLAQETWPKASLTTGLSVCLALEELLPKENILLKWPNDVYLRYRKICGVLVEVGPRLSQTLVIGIGMNVNNSFQTAPEELRSTATSMVDVTGQEVCLSRVLVSVLRHLEKQFARLSSNDPELAADWQSRCALVGRTIDIETGTSKTTGVCQGIDEEGAIVLLTEGGAARFFGGVVARIW